MASRNDLLGCRALRMLGAVAAGLFCCLSANGQRTREVPVSATETKTVVVEETISRRDSKQEIGSIFPGTPAGDLSVSHFTWGADIGSSIDLGGHDMSTFDLDVVMGYKSPFLRTLGVGAGIHRSFGSGNTFIPVYALLRTSFRSKPSLFFLNLKVGYSFNTVGDTGVKGGTNVSLGIGINLAMSKRYQSHIILSYGYFILDQEQQLAANMKVNHVDEAQIRFGITF